MKHRIALLSAFFAIFLFLLPLVTPKGNAVGWVITQPENFDQIIQDADATNKVQKEGFDSNTQGNMMNFLRYQIICTNLQKCKKSALSVIGNYIGMMYTKPPASSLAFIQDAGQTLGFIPKQAYAQGVGFSGLLPLLPIWKASRNIAYLLISVVMVIIGFLVMFRKKIDPKTVVTVQNALPRIIIAMLLVTFSYAIVGLMIDIMYLVMIFIINLLIATGNPVLGSTARDQMLSGGIWTLFSVLWWGGQQTVDDLVRLIFGNQITDINSFVTNAITLFIPFVLENLLVSLIIAIAMLFAFIRIFLMLLNAYIQIILSVLIAPLQLVLEAIPGTSSFSSWMINLIANLAVFPITAGMVLIGIILSQVDPNNPIWTPPLLTTGGGRGGIAGLIALGILMGIPSAVNSLKKALKAQAPVAAGPGVIFGPIAATGQTSLTTLQQFFYAQHILGPVAKWAGAKFRR